jgi:uncharacterized protein (DUF1330 family)
MAAYLVYFCHDFRDKKNYIDYADGIGETLKGIDVKLHVAYTKFEVLEGPDNVKGVVIMEFPSYEVAKNWYESEAYKNLRGRRIRNLYTGVLVDGGVTPLLERFPEVG